MTQIVIDIEIPEGATHYRGHLGKEPTFYKCSEINNCDHWFVMFYDADEWVLAAHSKPNWIKPIEPELLESYL